MTDHTALFALALKMRFFFLYKIRESTVGYTTAWDFEQMLKKSRWPY